MWSVAPCSLRLASSRSLQLFPDVRSHILRYSSSVSRFVRSCRSFPGGIFEQFWRPSNTTSLHCFVLRAHTCWRGAGLAGAEFRTLSCKCLLPGVVSAPFVFAMSSLQLSSWHHRPSLLLMVAYVLVLPPTSYFCQCLAQSALSKSDS